MKAIVYDELDVFFPIVFSVWEPAGDGFGGPVVTDPGAVFVAAMQEDDYEDDHVILKTSIAEMIADAIDGMENGPGGPIDPTSVPALMAIKQALIAGADQIDTALARERSA